jgi:hypothetical protein
MNTNTQETTVPGALLDGVLGCKWTRAAKKDAVDTELALGAHPIFPATARVSSSVQNSKLASRTFHFAEIDTQPRHDAMFEALVAAFTQRFGPPKQRKVSKSFEVTRKASWNVEGDLYIVTHTEYPNDGQPVRELSVRKCTANALSMAERKLVGV